MNVEKINDLLINIFEKLFEKNMKKIKSMLVIFFVSQSFYFTPEIFKKLMINEFTFEKLFDQNK